MPQISTCWNCSRPIAGPYFQDISCPRCKAVQSKLGFERRAWLLQEEQERHEKALEKRREG